MYFSFRIYFIANFWTIIAIIIVVGVLFIIGIVFLCIIYQKRRRQRRSGRVIRSRNDDETQVSVSTSPVLLSPKPSIERFVTDSEDSSKPIASNTKVERSYNREIVVPGNQAPSSTPPDSIELSVDIPQAERPQLMQAEILGDY